MSKVTSYVLIIAGVFITINGLMADGHTIILGILCGIAMIIGGVYSLDKKKVASSQPVPAEKAIEQAAAQDPATEKKKSVFTMAAAIIMLILFLTIGLGEYDTYQHAIGAGALIESVAGSMLLQSFCMLISCILFFTGHFGKNRTHILIASILACVAALFMILYLPFFALPIAFGFIGYARTK